MSIEEKINSCKSLIQELSKTFSDLSDELIKLENQKLDNNFKEKISSLNVGDEFTVPYTYNDKVYDWTFIVHDIEELANDKKALLLYSKYCTNDNVEFDKYGYNRYYDSSIRSWLNNEFLNRFPKEFTDLLLYSHNIECKYKDSIDIMNDKFYLLSREDEENKDNGYIDIEGKKRYVWTRSANRGFACYVWSVYPGCSTYADNLCAVAPVCAIELS